MITTSFVKNFEAENSWIEIWYELFRKISMLDAEVLFVWLVCTEVKHVGPFVVPRGKFGSLKLTQHFGVLVGLETSEAYIWRRFYDGLGLGEKHYVQILAVTQPQLLADEHQFWILTVSHKNGASTRTYHNLRVDAHVYRALRSLVMDVNATVFTLFNLKHLTIDLAR